MLASFPARIQSVVSASWREVEPREGQRDFGALRAAIVKASDGGRRNVRLGIEGSVWETRYCRALEVPPSRTSPRALHPNGCGLSACP